MATITETMPDYLRRAAEESFAKGGDGLFTSKQIAEHFGIKTVQAARKLEIHCDRGEVAYVRKGLFYYWKSVS